MTKEQAYKEYDAARDKLIELYVIHDDALKAAEKATRIAEEYKQRISEYKPIFEQKKRIYELLK